jgi:hypothetical protein
MANDSTRFNGPPSSAWLVPFSSFIALLGCASVEKSPAPPGMRRVFLSKQSGYVGGATSEMLVAVHQPKPVIGRHSRPADISM